MARTTARQNTIEIVARLEAETRAFKSRLKDVRRSLEGTSDKVEDMGRRTNRVTRTMAAGAGRVRRALGSMWSGVVVGMAAYGGIRLLRSIVTETAKVEQALAGVAKTTDLTRGELAGLKTRFLTLSTGLSASADELLNFAQLAGQMGVEGVKDLEKFAVTISKLQVATNVLGEEGALQMGQFLQMIGEAPEKVERVADVLVRLGNKLPVQERAILSASQRFAPFARQQGMGVADTMALAGGATVAAGGRPERAATAMMNLVQRINRLFQPATTNAMKEQQKALEAIVQMPWQRFGRKFRKDATGAIVEFLAKLRRFGPDMANMMEKMGMSAGAEGAGPISGMAQELEELVGWLRLARKEWATGGALQEEYAEFANTTTQAFKRMRNILQATKVVIGDIAAGKTGEGLADLENEMNKFFLFIRDNEDAHQFIRDLTTVMMGLASGIAAVVKGFIKLNEARRGFDKFLSENPWAMKTMEIATWTPWGSSLAENVLPSVKEKKEADWEKANEALRAPISRAELVANWRASHRTELPERQGNGPLGMNYTRPDVQEAQEALNASQERQRIREEMLQQGSPVRHINVNQNINIGRIDKNNPPDDAGRTIARHTAQALP